MTSCRAGGTPASYGPPLTALSRDIPAYGTHAARTLLTTVADGSAPGFEDAAARLVPR
ncbi:hypothetical protein [Streptomyces sp. JH34]|uniref:hypothetical protein n=1 Tax=unclassified Streptomyces TaxID=2593676 RepID=UPI0023F717EF|nr:hypothetical protein [Streptomyces sp. JH34]MDF6020589.1 hypothetical protein [Streptomyces sp. JH34]